MSSRDICPKCGELYTYHSGDICPKSVRESYEIERDLRELLNEYTLSVKHEVDTVTKNKLESWDILQERFKKIHAENEELKAKIEELKVAHAKKALEISSTMQKEWEDSFYDHVALAAKKSFLSERYIVSHTDIILNSTFISELYSSMFPGTGDKK